MNQQTTLALGWVLGFPAGALITMACGQIHRDRSRLQRQMAELRRAQAALEARQPAREPAGRAAEARALWPDHPSERTPQRRPWAWGILEGTEPCRNVGTTSRASTPPSVFSPQLDVLTDDDTVRLRHPSAGGDTLRLVKPPAKP